MGDGAAVNMLRGWMNGAAGARDGRWQSRYDDIPRAVSTARAKIGDRAEEDSGTDIRSAEETLAQLHYGTGRFHSDLLHFTFMSTTVDLQLVEVTVNRGFNRAREVLRDAPKESEEWRWGSDRWSLEEMCYSLINKITRSPACCRPTC